MMPHLLDVDALIALGSGEHIHHHTMVNWFAEHADEGWATCAFTTAGFVRVLSQPALSTTARTTAVLADWLQRNLAHAAHRSLKLDISFTDVLACCTGGVVGHRQVADAYLLTAAIRAKMKLLTFDRGIGALLASDAERKAHITVLR